MIDFFGEILQNNLDKLNKYVFNYLAENQNAMEILQNNVHKLDIVDWDYLAENPNAMEILQNNLHQVIWTSLSKNPNIFTIDYNYLKDRLKDIKLEIINYVIHPSKLDKWLSIKGNTIDSFFDIYT